MNYLITAAGKGSRFLKEGIKPPKPLIKVLGMELLIWSLHSFDFKEGDKIYIVTLKAHNVKRTLKEKLSFLYPSVSIFWLELDQILNGQLLTSLKAIKFFKLKGPLIIHNCDTFYKCDMQENLNFLKGKNVFGVIPFFKGKGNNWSFIKTANAKSNLALEVKEKERISDNCSVGTYIFSSCEELVNLTKKYLYDLNPDSSEFYIAPIYQYAIDNDKKTFITETSNIKLFGTIDELLESFKINFYELLGENSWLGNQVKTLVVDIDNTLCEKENGKDYSDAKPIQEVCDALRKANNEGNYIVLFTSRNMRSFNGSLGLINKYTAPKLLNWLNKNKIPFDEIYFGKPWGNNVKYIDDKSLSIKEFISE